MSSKQPPVKSLEPDQVIAAIRGRPENDAIAWLLQPANRLDQQLGRQGRAVGIDQANRAVPGGKKVPRGVEQAAPDRRLLGRQQLEAAGKNTSKNRSEPSG